MLPCASINTTLPWTPTYSYPSKGIPYPSTYPTVGKIPLPILSIYLPYPRHLSLHTCTHLTLPFITFPNLHFPTLYYYQGLIIYKAETTYQIRPKRPRAETTQAETTQAETIHAEMTRTKTTREYSCSCRTCRVVHLIIWLSIFVWRRIFWASNIFVTIVFPYTHDTGAVTDTEPGDEFYTLPLIEINTAAFQPFNTGLLKTNFNSMFFLN